MGWINKEMDAENKEGIKSKKDGVMKGCRDGGIDGRSEGWRNHWNGTEEMMKEEGMGDGGTDGGSEESRNRGMGR